MSSNPSASGERWSSSAVLDWLLHRGRRLESPDAVLEQLCSRVVDAGLQLDRVGVYLYFLHPLYLGIRLVWEPGQVKLEPAPWSMLHQQVGYANSPMERIRHGERVIRRHIEAPDCPNDFPVLADLAAEGMTDYVMVELVFSDESRHCASLATSRPGGFSEHDMLQLENLLHAFALIMESHTQRMLLQSLADTYLGRISGRRVLDGSIKRGDADLIDAVIWFCDLRDSTRLAETLGPRKFLNLLDDYFDATVKPVVKHGGEVLRFIGDASLAVFPIGPQTMDANAACDAAISAAREARHNVGETNLRRSESGFAQFNYGIGLHRGEVLYGNIGIADRLEFSVIGEAANEAARIESLCKTIGKRLVVSKSVECLSSTPLDDLGFHKLAGVANAMQVFGLAD